MVSVDGTTIETWRDLETAMLTAGGRTVTVALRRDGTSFQVSLTPKEVRGRVMAAIGNLNLVAAACASAVAGFLYQLDPVMPFLTCVFIDILVLTLILLFLREPEAREA